MSCNVRIFQHLFYVFTTFTDTIKGQTEVSKFLVRFQKLGNFPILWDISVTHSNVLIYPVTPCYRAVWVENLWERSNNSQLLFNHKPTMRVAARSSALQIFIFWNALFKNILASSNLIVEKFSGKGVAWGLSLTRCSFKNWLSCSPASFNICLVLFLLMGVLSDGKLHLGSFGGFPKP